MNSSPRLPQELAEDIQGVLWAEGVASGTVRLPDDGDRFIEQFNTIYSRHGLMLLRDGQVKRDDVDR